MSGWGDGEWGDMPWGGGDYPYAPIDISYVTCHYDPSIAERAITGPMALTCTYRTSLPSIVKDTQIVVTAAHKPSVEGRGSYRSTIEFTGTP